MKVIDIIRLNEPSLRLMQDNNITVKSIKYIGMYNEFEELCSKGYKLTYVYTLLSMEYQLEERNVRRIISNFKSELKK